MHAIGDSRAMIFKSAESEFFILSMLSASTAIIFSTILSSIIFYQFFDLIYTPNLSILALAFFVAISFIFLAGVISIRKSIYASPMITLRDS